MFACAGAIVGSLSSMRPIKFSKAVSMEEAKGQGPFIALETRSVFRDLRAKRLEYAEWTEKNVPNK